MGKIAHITADRCIPISKYIKRSPEDIGKDYASQKEFFDELMVDSQNTDIRSKFYFFIFREFEICGERTQC